jgi:tripeptide aminopeptidase
VDFPPRQAPRATREEKERLLDEFVRLCEVESPSYHERPMADAVAAALQAAGLEVEEDGTRAETGSNAGNLLARIPGPEGARTVLLCAHLDTVPQEAPVEVVRENGMFRNRHEAILGADNKAAVVLMLALARRFARERPPVDLELLFTTCEEVSLLGAKAFDAGRLRSEYGFVFDHATPIGELILAAPTLYTIQARLHGQSAHAGIRPEAGHNAIAAAARGLAALELGRIDPETTANVGLIRGGTAINVVAERCTAELEARSLDSDKAARVTSEIVDRLTEAASDASCDIEVDVQEQFRAYRLPRTAPPVRAAAEALEALGIEPSYRSTGGASDAHVFQAAGIPCLNVANGTEANHQPDERVSVLALETMLDVALGLVARCA